MNWLFFTLCAVVINTSLGLGLRTLSKQSANPRIMGFVYNCYAALTSVIIWIVSGAPLPTNVPFSAILLLCLSALGYGIFQRGQFYLRKHVEVSELAPVMQVGLISGILAALIILNEPLNPKKILGITAIVGASLLVTLNKKLTINKYAITAIGISSALSIAGIIDKLASPHYPLFFYTALIWILPLPFIAYPAKSKDIRAAIKSSGWKIPLLASLNALSLVFFVRALQIGEASKVIPVLSTVTVLTVIGGILVLGETKYWKRKLLAGVLATLGVLVIR